MIKRNAAASVDSNQRSFLLIDMIAVAHLQWFVNDITRRSKHKTSGSFQSKFRLENTVFFGVWHYLRVANERAQISSIEA